ncbi:MAG: hypothetical protein ACE5JE_08750 [Thermoplasmata archaeon]
MPIEWEYFEMAAEKDRGPIRGRYRLTKEHREKLMDLLSRNDGAIMIQTELVRALFHDGRGQPGAQSMVTALNRNFGDTFRFSTRDKGKKIAIRLV